MTRWCPAPRRSCDLRRPTSISKINLRVIGRRLQELFDHGIHLIGDFDLDEVTGPDRLAGARTVS